MKKLFNNLFFCLICFCALSFMNTAIVGAEEVVELSDCNKYIYQLGGMLGDESVLNPDDYLGFTTYAVPTDYELAKAYIISEMEKGTQDIDMSEYTVYQWEMNDLFIEILNQNPQLFYIESWHYYYNSNTQLVSRICPDIRENYKEEALALERAAESILAKVDYEYMSDVDVALYLHDYLASHIAYAKDELMAGPLYQGKDIYNSYGALVDGRAVCQGYAEAYQLLLQKCGIPCAIVSSPAMNHAWNLIFVNEQWYHVDVTWDDPMMNQEGRVLHKYFLASDDEMKNDLGHYGWTEGILCEDDTYRTYWWDDVKSSIIFKDNKKYYLKVIEEFRGKMALFERQDNNTSKIRTMNWLKIDPTYSGRYYVVEPGFSYVNMVFYWNDTKNIYSWNGDKDIEYSGLV